MEKEEIMKRPMFLQVISFLILASSVTCCTQIQIRMYIVMISSRKRDNNISECEGNLQIISEILLLILKCFNGIKFQK